jgi:glutamate synthase domain-containing protein 2/glutamate synthase domain-containing protein 1/glutamate synthase domain-containing protein 3
MIKNMKEILAQEFHDACGIGFIAELSGKPSRRTIDYSIEALKNMSHRGASGADDRTSDGTGLLTDIPFEYFKLVLEEELNIKFDNGILGIAMVFTTEQELLQLEKDIVSKTSELNINYLGKRDVPINKAILGEIAKESCPLIIQFFFLDNEEKNDFETRLYILRKSVEQTILAANGETFICSLSSKTIVYKGMMRPYHLARFYSDLNQPEFKAKVSLFHERFSTNTVSSWSMAQPFRMLGHNGEINTTKGNRLWMQTREATIKSTFWDEKLKHLKPIVSQSGSDSYSLDNILEFLVRSGRSLFHSAMMLIPEPYIFDKSMPQELKDFYIYHENHIEPWDGPAALVFCDGDIVGAKLDRNGLRPLRYTLTKDDLVIMASEAGVVDLEEKNILMHHHMKSGENFAIKLDGSGILTNKDIVNIVTGDGKYSRMLQNNLSAIERGLNVEEFGDFSIPEGGFDKRLRIAFGIDKEDIERFIMPIAESGKESVGSMGDDTPPAGLSAKPRKFYEYFKQQFAQVTNPPIDSIRERYVMSLYRYIGSETDLLNENDVFDGAIRIDGPILSPREVKFLLEIKNKFPHAIIKCHLKVEEDLAKRIEEIRAECECAVNKGVKIIFLSDEGLREEYIPIPMLLVVSAIHQDLIKKKLRNKTALLCFTGDVVEDHHIASLVAFGASAVYPYIAYELIREIFADADWVSKMGNYRSALEKGLLKIMAKMGISTVSSYHGSMLFHAIGISQDLIDEYFPSVKNILGGADLDLLKKSLLERNGKAFNQKIEIEEIGRFRFRKEGEAHGFTPAVFKQIQNISQSKNNISENKNRVVYLRDLFDIIKSNPVPIEKVEPAQNILNRIGLGAISFGAVSEEVHRTLARAASLLGIRSNTGEGGEQKDRYSISNPDKSESCYTKQIASARFGVTTAYLTAAREIQIKIGQGAKPGEGGQLPGEKVTLSIANDRHTTPGVPLISPPPHHDIYSIEDLAQLIYDLKQVNPGAKICVKLVSQFGIGIIASGVVKAGADTVLISGNDGGTGASPLGSLKHTGLPWEIGLTEVHRTLYANGLRNRVTLRVDGGIKNAHDIITAALLGAEEYDFGTSALIALGCVMARQCHQNTCPAGIATQDKELKKKFKGKPENLVSYLKKISEDVRMQLSEMGFTSISEIVGRNELLTANQNHRKFLETRKIDIDSIISLKQSYFIDSTIKVKQVSTRFDQRIGEEVIAEVRDAIMTHGRVIVSRKLKNTDRAIGARLSGLISFLYGPSGFKGSIQYQLNGSAGQSLGAFLVDNIELRHRGVANDYVGKGMSGGLITIRFPRNIRKSLEGNTIIGNVALYGATGGEMFVAGKAGERFAVRNSGAAAVVEGVSNHCCEYMTRGLIIVLGEIGKNFGAGMTGGTAFIYGDKISVVQNINIEYIKIDEMKTGDEGLLYKYLVNHEFHTGSTIAKSILGNWETEKANFVKIIPRAIETINLDKIYEEQFKSRLLEVFKI